MSAYPDIFECRGLEELVGSEDGVVKPGSNDVFTLRADTWGEIRLKEFVVFSVEDSDETADR